MTKTNETNIPVAIRVEGISKIFKLPNEKSNSLKSMAVNFWRHDKGYELQKALDDISFEVKQGEFFGIVGRNGSGKSTLLKLLSGIYLPDKGNIQVNGKLTPFIELGVGFNPELTGRENVFLNGALLGFSRKEMKAMYKDIVDFAELHRFMDQKLKNYSSGMQVRLAFSIATRVNSDILVLDEVLAVGDSAFQKKCLDYFRKLKREKRTVILVSHSMDTIEKYCTYAILVHNGKIIHKGEAGVIAAEYEQLNLIDQQNESDEIFESHDAEIVDVKINGKKNLIIKEPIIINLELKYKTRKDIKVAGSMSVVSSDGTLLANLNMKKDPRLKLIRKGKTGVLICRINTKQFLAGTYRIDTAIYEEDMYLDRHYNAVSFSIVLSESIGRGGLLNLDGGWQFD